MKICTLASGSKGNSSLVCSETTNILIDIGISYRELLRRFQSVGFDGSINAVMITHLHSDHIKGLEMFVKNTDATIYINFKAYTYLMAHYDIADSRVKTFDTVFRIGDIDIMPFSTPHDSPYSCGYTLDSYGERISVATDLGTVTERVFSRIKDSNIVLLESNYDKGMLYNGSYPYPLKKRIDGEKGHLSNEDCAKAVVELSKNNVKKIILGHLSENNNTPELALSETKRQLKLSGQKVELFIAEQHRPLEFIIC